MSEPERKFDPSTCRILMAPAPQDNAYCSEVADTLKLLGCSVQKTWADTAAQITKHSAAIDVLHLQWLDPLIRRSRGRDSVIALLMLVKSLMQLRAQRKRVVWTVHNIAAHEPYSNTLDYLGSWLVAKLSNRLIVHSNTAQKRVSRRFFTARQKIHIIPHPDLAPYYRRVSVPQDLRAKLGIPRDSLLLLSFGQIRPYKGHLALLDAFRRCEDANLSLLLVGSPTIDNAASAIEQVAREDQRVRLLFEYAPDSLVASIHDAADIVCLTYREILTSGAGCTAMGFGKPCLAPCTPYFQELFHKGGAFLYQPGQLLSALRSLVHQRHRFAEMGRANLETASPWSQEALQKAYQQVLEKMV